jgi:hypothetical protein
MVESIFQNLWSVLAVDDEKINGKTRELQIDHFLRFFFQTCLASLDFGRRLLLFHSIECKITNLQSLMSSPR